ncbi:Uma2 family endonuclease [Gloeothece verrucosa]|uniref:Putative restriction endonuclease domain-containing protein n=1 Tax=Gloeothece verrucosa (strain PCC 7822) TaxID=497965 RepID=E0UIV6_GLOV7|nr:Uma2 family endonuclease [Gloeothece verrucosa]ADN13415.1 protein of unknown function DUF820 [Gloeothece verrucosa PCC 7822]
MTAAITPVISESSLNSLPLWKPATWEDYLTYRDDPSPERIRLYFYNNHLLVDMGKEGIEHSSINSLFSMLLGFWFAQHPEQVFSLFNGCLLEKPNTQAGAPDLVLYIGEDYPRWQAGDRRYINLEENRVPNLVGEIADTTLATDLDEKKHLYAALGIPEYWVIDVRGKRVFAFILEEGIYKETDQSVALAGLPIHLLEQTLERLAQESNGSAATWFLQQIVNLNPQLKQQANQD